MRTATTITRCFAVAALLLTAPTARAAVRVTATDDRGVTFEVTVPAWSANTPAPLRGVWVEAPGFHVTGEPGRPQLPAASALFALPPGARATVRVLSEDGVEVREGVDVAVSGKPGFRRNEANTDWVPVMDEADAVRDGAWPAQHVVAGTAFSMRGRRLMPVEVYPFRWDAGTRRLEVARRMVVRVDFTVGAGAAMRAAGAGAADPHFDDVWSTGVTNFEQARAWRVAPGGPASFRSGPARVGPFAGQAAMAFDEDFPEVRVKLDSTGLYVLPFDDLQTQGFPIGVPVAEVSVHRHEFLEGADPPYGTIELPIEVEDANTNGVFDSGDAVWLYTRSWADRANVSFGQRRWGDAEVLYATRKSGGGLRMSQRSGWRSATTPSLLTSYPWSQRFERNFEYTAFPRDTASDPFTWTPSPSFYYLRDDTIRFEVNHIDTTRTARVSVTFDGRDQGLHWMWAQVKNGSGQFTSVVDSVAFSGKGAFTPPAATVFGSALSEGRTNTFRLFGKASSGPPGPTNQQTNATLNGFDVTYWRRYRALRDVLRFNTGDGAGEVQMHATGFSSASARLYDVSSPGDPVRVNVAPAQWANEGANGWAFDLQDSVATGERRQYVAAVTPTIPDPSAYTPVTRRNLAGAAAGDYLLVVPEAFLPAVQPLVDLRQSQGLRVLVAPLESLNDEFNGGRKSAYAIRRFVRFAYQKWDSRFLLLMGDGSQNPQQFGAMRDPDYVPVRFVPSQVGVGEGAETITSDAWYGCITGECDPATYDTPGEPLPMSELFIGRLPVHSLTETQQVVSKLVAYENLAGDQSWRRKLLLQSDDSYSTSSFGGVETRYCFWYWEEVFRTINEACSTVVVRDAGLTQMQPEVFNDRFYLANEPWTSAAAGDTCRPDVNATVPRARASIQPALFSRLNEGRLWWNYQGHANSQLLAHENFYVSQGPGASDASLFANDGKPFLWSAFSCHANAHSYMLRIDRQQIEAIGAEMLLLPNRGAIATYASTGFEIIPRPSPFSHINTYLARFLFETPPKDEVLGERGARVVLGESIAAMLLSYLPTVRTVPLERAVGFSYNLLGDPATRLSIGAPQSSVLANGTAVTSGTPVRLHTAGDTLRIDADLVSSVRLDSLGLWEQTSTGQTPIAAANYTVTPSFPDTGASSVTGGRRYRLTYRAPLRHETYRYVIRTRDRDGLFSDFVVPFELRGLLRVDGATINDGDDVSPAANLSMMVLSPKPLNPQADLTLTVNGVSQPFTATAAPGDGSGREWILSWTHDVYPVDDFSVVLQVAGGATITRTFRVTTAAGQLALRNAYVFPNPFDDDLGAHFSFSLAGSEAADVRISVFTTSGRVVYTRTDRGLTPGYHQIAWDGRDAEGDKLANGVYFYRLSVASTSGAKQEQLGRLVKLRKPRRVVEPTIP